MPMKKEHHVGEVEFEGWLYKWANYLKGYRKRWFILKDGILSYYISPNHRKKCRGSIELMNSLILQDEPRGIVIADSVKSITFHLRAPTELERQQWVTSLELSKARAIDKVEELEEENMRDEQVINEMEMVQTKLELQEALKNIHDRLEDISKRNASATKLVTSLPASQDQTQVEHRRESDSTIETLRQWLSELQDSTNDLIQASSRCVDLARSDHKCWKQMLHEHERRVNLEQTLVHLARQHCDLQKVAEEVIEMRRKNKPCQPDCTNTQTPGSSTSVQYIVSTSEGRLSRLNIHSRASGSPSRNASSESESGEESESKPTVSRVPLDDVQDDSHEHRQDKEHEKTSTSVTQLLSVQDIQKWSQSVDMAQKREELPGTSKVVITEITPILGPEDEVVIPRRERRMSIPEKPKLTSSIWSVMKGCIGKDLTKISFPIKFCEPLSSLQRLTEDFEYSDLLDKAANCNDSSEQLVYVSAFAVSAYNTTYQRTSKPFNPLLGETYECDRRDDYGWRCISEQVSHHPPVTAQHCEGSGWNCWQEISPSVKFMGQYLKMTPLGIVHLEFTESGYHYTWKKVPTTVHNLILGTIAVENHGDMTITNHTTSEKCSLYFHPHKPFSSEEPCKVTGAAMDMMGNVTWVLDGTWKERMKAEKVLSRRRSDNGDPLLETSNPGTIWKRRDRPDEYKHMYNFTMFACQLNEPEDGIAPTDSRLRPDIRCMENGDVNEASELKHQLEEKQRAARRRREEEAEKAAEEGQPYVPYEPIWFKKKMDPITSKPIFIYAGEYWQCKERQDWSKCPDIFL